MTIAKSSTYDRILAHLASLPDNKLRRGLYDVYNDNLPLSLTSRGGFMLIKALLNHSRYASNEGMMIWAMALSHADSFSDKQLKELLLLIENNIHIFDYNVAAEMGCFIAKRFPKRISTAVFERVSLLAHENSYIFCRCGLTRLAQIAISHQKKELFLDKIRELKKSYSNKNL